MMDSLCCAFFFENGGLDLFAHGNAVEEEPINIAAAV